MSSAATIYLGLDVHKDSVTIAVLPAGAIAPTRVERLANDLAKLRRFCERLAPQGEVRACYAASGAGYVLHQAMTAWGVHCDVIAPSLIPIKPGVQRKHDTHDAVQLARLYRAGELLDPGQRHDGEPHRPRRGAAREGGFFDHGFQERRRHHPSHNTRKGTAKRPPPKRIVDAPS